MAKHKVQKIAKGKYSYRGYYIYRDSINKFWCIKDSDTEIVWATDTLKSMKKFIDEKENNNGHL